MEGREPMRHSESRGASPALALYRHLRSRLVDSVEIARLLTLEALVGDSVLYLLAAVPLAVEDEEPVQRGYRVVIYAHTGEYLADDAQTDVDSLVV